MQYKTTTVVVSAWVMLAGACAIQGEDGWSAGQECTNCAPGDSTGETGERPDEEGGDAPGPTEPDDGKDEGRDDDGGAEGQDDGSDAPTDPGDGDDDHDETETCCDGERTYCDEVGESSSVCDGLDAVCRGGECSDVLTLCDVTTIPVSEPCARAVHECFGIRINKCHRTAIQQCLDMIGDEELCAAWDASCAAREAYCAAAIAGLGCDDAPEDQNEQESCDEHLEYLCTDWGHGFDPCYATYLACADDPALCHDALDQCAQENQGELQWCEADHDTPSSGSDSDSGGAPG